MSEQQITRLTQAEYDEFYEEFLVHAAETGMDREFEWLNTCIDTRFDDWLRDMIGEYELVV